jgi:large subunit ribosomal protein L25
MDTLKLDVQLRDSNISASQLRKTKLVPAVYYGKGVKNTPLQVEYQPLRQLFLKAGYSTLVDLNIAGKSSKVLIHEVKLHPLKGTIEHVDFLHVNLKEEITTEVPIEITGVSPAVKDFGGVLNTVKPEVEIKCLPSDIPHSISVDISSLTELSSAFYIKDLSLPKGVKVLNDPDDVIVIVNAPRVEEAETPAAEAVEGGEASVEGGKEEGGEDKAE